MSEILGGVIMIAGGGMAHLGGLLAAASAPPRPSDRARALLGDSDAAVPPRIPPHLQTLLDRLD